MQKEIEVIPVYYDNFLTQKYPVNILVGGRASGKTFFIEQMTSFNLNNKKGYKLLVVEDVETNIGEGVKDGILNRIEELGQETIYKATKQPPSIVNKVNGNSVIFKGYHSEAQQKQVKSLNEVTACFYEEAENITYNQFKALRMQLRGGEPEDRQMFLALNPISQDSFINNYFFKQEPDEVLERFKDGRPKVFVKNIKVDVDDQIINIPCMVVVTVHWDNKYLTAEQRADIEELKQTDPDMYAMLAEGKFIKPAGTFFKEFKKHIHVIDPFIIPAHWNRISSIDYGLDMLAGLWIAIDEHGKGYVYKETNNPDLIISEAARKLIDITNKEKLYIRYGPGDLWNRRQETGKSAWEIFTQNGWVMNKADRNRANGALAMKEWLHVYKTRDEQTGEEIETSDLKIFSNCTTLISHLSQIQTDERDPNCYATEPHELTHIVDAMRYFAIMRTSPSAVRKQKAIPSQYNFNEKPVNNPFTTGYSDEFMNQF